MTMWGVGAALAAVVACLVLARFILPRFGIGT
jgi:hypothetical protein